MPELLKAILLMFSNRFIGGAPHGFRNLPTLCCYSLYLEIQPVQPIKPVIDNSIDQTGDGILSYPDYQVHIKAGKNITSNSSL